jgi:hypothetical protein
MSGKDEYDTDWEQSYGRMRKDLYDELSPTSWEDRLVQPWKDLGTSRTQIVMFPKKS